MVVIPISENTGNMARISTVGNNWKETFIYKPGMVKIIGNDGAFPCNTKSSSINNFSLFEQTFIPFRADDQHYACIFDAMLHPGTPTFFRWAVLIWVVSNNPNPIIQEPVCESAHFFAEITFMSIAYENGGSVLLASMIHLGYLAICS